MKETKKIKKMISFPWLLLALSLVINLSFLVVYFLKILPYQRSLDKKVSELSTQIDNDVCTKVYSQSAKKFICLTKEELKSKSLSECSINFRENLNVDTLKGLRDIKDLEKLRELSIKMCMQERGHDYK